MLLSDNIFLLKSIGEWCGRSQKQCQLFGCPKSEAVTPQWELRIYCYAHVYLFLNHTKSISRTIAVFACASLPHSLGKVSRWLLDCPSTAPAIHHLCLPQLRYRCAQPPQPLTWLLEIRILVPLHIKHSYPLSPRVQTLTVSVRWRAAQP